MSGDLVAEVVPKEGLRQYVLFYYESDIGRLNTKYRHLESGKYHDFTIKCKEKTWKAHRVVLTAWSTYFGTVCDSQFKVSLEK